jgi:hypothetical protein
LYYGKSALEIDAPAPALPVTVAGRIKTFRATYFRRALFDIARFRNIRITASVRRMCGLLAVP